MIERLDADVSSLMDTRMLTYAHPFLSAHRPAGTMGRKLRGSGHCRRCIPLFVILQAGSDIDFCSASDYFDRPGHKEKCNGTPPMHRGCSIVNREMFT
jgi:hypothetical protein